MSLGRPEVPLAVDVGHCGYHSAPGTLHRYQRAFYLARFCGVGTNPTHESMDWGDNLAKRVNQRYTSLKFFELVWFWLFISFHWFLQTAEIVLHSHMPHITKGIQ